MGFGLQLATEPETAKGIWKGIKSMTPAKVKKMLLGAASEKLAKYAEGGNTMKHEVGKDGVQAAMFVFGGVKNIKNGAELIDDLGAEVVGTSKDGDIATDQGGHLIASIFNGAGEQINYVPMLQRLNQGAWRSMEATWQTALQAGKKVEVDIKVIYEGTSKRPKKFEVDYKIGEDIFQREFNN